jgi:hypothetical protein
MLSLQEIDGLRASGIIERHLAGRPDSEPRPMRTRREVAQDRTFDGIVVFGEVKSGTFLPDPTEELGKPFDIAKHRRALSTDDTPHAPLALRRKRDRGLGGLLRLIGGAR